jgi:hypothetical protein
MSFAIHARFSSRQAIACGLFAALLDVALAFNDLRAVSGGKLLNPDSYMRLVRLQDILAADMPLDAVARDGSGTGTVLHWSHLLDSLLLIPATPLMPMLGQHEALRWAGIMLGPLGAGCLGAAVAWAAAPMTDPDWRWTAPLTAMLAVPVLAYTLPGVVHHHALAALAAVMCAGWAGRAGTGGPAAGFHLGAWASFGLWLTPETAVPSLLAFGAVGVGWLCHPYERRWGTALASGTTALVVLVALALLVDPPLDNAFAMDVDRLSIVWLVFALLGGLAGWWLWLLDRIVIPGLKRAGMGIVGVIFASAIWLALFPQVLRGPEGVLNGSHANTFEGIAEMQPITAWQDAVVFLLPGVFAVLVAAILAIRLRSWQFAYTAGAVILLIAAAVLHRRFSAYQCCAGAIAMPLAITMINTSLANQPVVRLALARMGLLLFILIAPLITYRVARPAEAAMPAVAGQCDIAKAAPMLEPYSGQIVLADVNDTPELLYRSRVLTVGSLYHRDPEGYLRLRAAWRAARSDGVPAAGAATGAQLVLFCRKAARSNLVRDLPSDTLWDQLGSGRPPPWLRLIASDPETGLQLFQIY